MDNQFLPLFIINGTESIEIYENCSALDKGAMLILWMV